MKARISQNGDVMVVHVSGHIDYETVSPFRETCMTQFRKRKVVFNLENLSFVGSSGITQFVQTLQDLAEASPDGLKVCQASSEFRKVLTSNDIRGLQIFEEQFQAEQSFFMPLALPLQT